MQDDPTTPAESDPIARIHSNGAKPEPEPQPKRNPSRATREELYEGLLHLASDDQLDTPVPDLTRVPASAEVVRQVRADVSYVTYRLGNLTRSVNRDRAAALAQYAILWAMLVLVSRRLDKVVRAVRELRGAVA